MSVTIVPWSTGSDEQIAAMLDAAAAGEIDLQQDGGWQIGDTRRISIMSFKGGGDVINQAEDIDIVITSFAEYNNCGNILQFDFKNTLSSPFRIDVLGSASEGYGLTESYRNTLPNLVKALPVWMQDRLKTFDVLSYGGYPITTTKSISGNKLALRSTSELFGTTPGYGNEGAQIEYYSNSINRIKTRGLTNEAILWLSRSVLRATTLGYSLIDADGSDAYYAHSQDRSYSAIPDYQHQYYIAPFGCLGGYSPPSLIPRLVPFSDGTDDDLTEILDAAASGIIDLQADAGWAVGDIREIIIESYLRTDDSDTRPHRSRIVITSFDEYNECGNLLQFDSYDTFEFGQRMNPTNTTEGGYRSSEMYINSLPTMANALPEWIKARLKTFSVSADDGTGIIENVPDNRLALRSLYEIFGAYDSRPQDGTQLTYYKTPANRRKKPMGVVDYVPWWLRTPFSSINFYLGPNDDNGTVCSSTNAKLKMQVAPFGCLGGIERSYENIPLDAEHFPDEAFRQTLHDYYDIDGDWVLSAAEIAKIQILMLYLNASNIHSLEGIKYLSCLKVLWIPSDDLVTLQSLDLSGMSQLEAIITRNVKMGSIDLTGCTSLRVYIDQENDVESLDFASCPNLEFLIVDFNDQLTQISFYKTKSSLPLKIIHLLRCLSLSEINIPFSESLSDLEVVGWPANIYIIEIPIIKNIYTTVEPYSGPYFLGQYGNVMSYAYSSKRSTPVNDYVFTGYAGKKSISDSESSQSTIELKNKEIPSGNYSNNRLVVSTDCQVVNKSVDIITQPEDVNTTMLATEDPIFTVNAIGINLSYQWESLSAGATIWERLSDATSNSLTVPLQAENDGYQYRCRIKSGDDELVTRAALLTILVPPSITEQPSSISVIEGQITKFSVKATGNDLTYKWQFASDGATWNDLRNSDTDEYELLVSLALNGYQYRCVVTNDLGTATSEAATLTVTADTSVVKPAITTQPMSETVDEGTSATFAVVASGNDLSYQWQVFQNSQWTNITGETNSSYVVSAARNINGSRYRCAVSNAAGAVYSDPATLTVTTGVYVTTPRLLTQPRSVNVDLGELVTFWVRADGGSLNYQWQRLNDSTWYDITGATGSSYQIMARTEVHNTQYRCVVTNTAGAAYSNSATLSIRAGQELSFYGYHSIIISGKNTYGEWEMYPTSRPHVAPPEVKTSYVDLPGADGGLDYTDLLTGEPRYGYRKGSWEFMLIPQDRWAEVYRSLVNFLHGKIHTVILEDDPNFVYTGRLTVNEWQSAAHNSLITIDYVLEPFARDISGEQEDQRTNEILDAANELLSKQENAGMVIAKVSGGAALIDPSMLFENGDNIVY